MYVIYLSTSDTYNRYGYWTGKTYKNDDVIYPGYDEEITERTKRYKIKQAAEKTAEKLLERYSYVKSWEVKEIDD